MLQDREEEEEAFDIFVKSHGRGDPIDPRVLVQLHHTKKAPRLEKQFQCAGPQLFFKTMGDERCQWGWKQSDGHSSLVLVGSYRVRLSLKSASSA